MPAACLYTGLLTQVLFSCLRPTAPPHTHREYRFVLLRGSRYPYSGGNPKAIGASIRVAGVGGGRGVQAGGQARGAPRSAREEELCSAVSEVMVVCIIVVVVCLIMVVVGIIVAKQRSTCCRCYLLPCAARNGFAFCCPLLKRQPGLPLVAPVALWLGSSFLRVLFVQLLGFCGWYYVGVDVGRRCCGYYCGCRRRLLPHRCHFCS